MVLHRLSLFLFAFTFFGCALSEKAVAQESARTDFRNLFAEIGGNGGVYSVCFENKFLQRNRSRFQWSAGFSLVPGSGRSTVDFPVGLNWVYGSGKHKAEIGTGQVLVLSIGGGKGGTIRGTARFGYRFEKPGARSYWLFSYTPFYSYIHNFQYEHWAGIAWGFYFKK